VSLPAFPAVDPRPQQRQCVAPAQRTARASTLRSPLLLGAAVLCVLAAGGLGALALRSKNRPAPAERSKAPVIEQDRAAQPTADHREAPPPTDRARESVASPQEPEPEIEPALPPAPEARKAMEQQPSEWPPARAFTARCKAPGGGCLPRCTALAGGRCLDPCFIHTAECSRDCLKSDGSCGWPPPDPE
jgi:hypothetical protein